MPEPMYFRSIPTEVEYEIRTDGPSPRFTGYAAVFNSDSEPMPYVETIQPGAFTRTLKSEAARHTFVMDHDDTRLLASRRAKTLTLTEDSRGLLVEADLPDTSYARDLIELHERGEARSMSFTFKVPKGGEAWTPTRERRTVTETKLGHVAVLTGLSPAYRQTSASIRSLAHVIGADADALAEAIEDLRDNRALDDGTCGLLVRSIASLIPEEDRWSKVASDASSATYSLSSLLSLLGDTSQESDLANLLKTAITSLQSYIALQVERIGTDADVALSRTVIPMSIARARLALAARAR